MKKIFEVNDDADILFGGSKKKPNNSDQNNSKEPKKKKVKKTSNQSEKSLRRQRIVAWVLIVCVGLGIVGTAGIWAFAIDAWKDNPDLYAEDFASLTATKLISEDGVTYHTTGLKTADAITYDELPQVLVDAFIATEDSRFFIHNGVDTPRFIKAMMVNVKDSITGLRLSFSQGGSTITMQLIKNTYFVKEDVEGGDSQLAADSGIKGVQRKFQELFLATELEKQQVLTKQEQVAFYLNNIYFGAGNNTMGIQSSTRRYFDKDVKELNLLESAFMAGVINAPNAYSPYQSIRKAKERTDVILDLMLMHGYISKDEHAVAKATPLENLFVDRQTRAEESYEYQAYIDLVYEEVKTLTGHSMTAAPMIITTNMNTKVQDGIEKVQRREVAAMNPGEDSYLQMGSALVENGTGAIVGVFGGYDYDTRLAFNRARDTKMQPASIIKAVLSYPLAFEHLGISSQHIMTDAPYVHGGMTADTGLVNNYDHRFLGDVELNFNFADSRNTTAIRLLEDTAGKIGGAGVIKYMNDIGISGVSSFDPVYAIGGGNMLTSPLEMAEALSTIMNYGEHIKPTTIQKIEFLDGREPIINEPKATQVIDEASAYLSTDLMKYAVAGANPGFLINTRKSYPVFGKTGTNGWSKEGAARLGIAEGTAKNRNMLTATDRFSISTWVGFDDEKKEHRPWMDERLVSMNIPGKFNSYVLDLLADVYGAGKDLDKPADVVDITHIKGPFPYQRPIEGMNPDMIVTGQINKRHLSLVDPEPQSLDSLKNVEVESSQMGNQVSANMTFTPYPDESKLTIAPNTREMTIPGTDRVVTGRRLYDDSWLYGAVEYVVDVTVDGTVVDTIKSSKDVVGVRVNVPAGSKLELCGYYGYSNSSTVFSNKLCKTIDVKSSSPADSVTLPNINESILSLKNNASKNGVQLDITYEFGSIADLGKVLSIKDDKDNVLAGKTMSTDEFKSTKIQVIVSDYHYDLNDPSKNPYPVIGDFYKNLNGLVSINEPSAAEMTQNIQSFNGNKTQISLLKDHMYNPLTLK